MENNNKSYFYAEKQEELDRLKLQASAVQDIELGILEKHGLSTHLDVLDVGCGPGFTTSLLADRCQPTSLLGVDNNPELISKAKELANSNNQSTVFSIQDVYEINLSKKFDFAYARFLFQHLEKPVKALKSISNVLKENGRLCILDIDEDFLHLHPPLHSFIEIKEKVILQQKKRGGDRLIGKKLRNLLIEAGFEEINVTILPVTSNQIGLDAFFDLTTSFKKELLTNKDDVDQFNELKKIMKNENYFGVVSVFFVSGVKR
ncbi:class I SAM-dependent methyltransferase [Bacillus salitolerans]|uniref:Class I SAM-dependent methyltransferase n=1 Tax=Bacillus salitolerans TaxID=1437434 RepID=A0ABW4LLS1_9BACI